MIYTDDIIGDQLTIFFGAAMLGILVGGCFDLFWAIKLFLGLKRKPAAVADIFFCIWTGFLTFSFLLNENYGIPRFYIYFGEALGFLTWYFTVGRVIRFVLKKLKKITDKIFAFFLPPIKRIYTKISVKTKKILIKCKNIFIKNVMNSKKLLKKKTDVVYNKLYLNGKKAFSFCGRKAGKESESFENIREEERFTSDCSYCIRNVSDLFSDINSNENK